MTARKKTPHKPGATSPSPFSPHPRSGALACLLFTPGTTGKLTLLVFVVRTGRQPRQPSHSSPRESSPGFDLNQFFASFTSRFDTRYHHCRCSVPRATTFPTPYGPRLCACVPTSALVRCFIQLSAVAVDPDGSTTTLFSYRTRCSPSSAPWSSASIPSR